jgi:hypothetical protein
MTSGAHINGSPVPSPLWGELGRGCEAGTRFTLVAYRPARGRYRQPSSVAPSPSRGGGRRRLARAFTLVEVVLAIGLSAVVVYLLSTATEQYLTNVDASRGRVESSQLARTLLDQIAADLYAARFHTLTPATGGAGGPGMPQQSGPGQPSSPGGGSMGGGPPPGGGMQAGGPQGGAGFGAMSGGNSPGGTMPAGSGSMPPAAGSVQGLFGTAEQLRIDRGAYANWERAAREIESTEGAAAADFPMTVRYFFADADELTTQDFAQRGVSRETTAPQAKGLYRETIPTAAIQPTDTPLPSVSTTRTGATLELLAPEVVAMELAYFNGKELVDEWDPVTDRGMPIGVEIRLTVAEPSFTARPSAEERRRLAEGRYRESELIEYRRYVRLPLVAASPPAQPLLPVAEQGGQPQSGPQGGQGGDGDTGGSRTGGSE